MTAEERPKSWWTRMFRGGEAGAPDGEGEGEDGLPLDENDTPMEELAAHRHLIDDLASQLDEATAQVAASRKRSAELERERDELLAAQQVLSARCSRADELLQRSRREAETAETEREALRATVAVAEGRAAEMTKAAEDARRGLEERELRLKMHASELAKLRVKSRKAQQGADRHQAELAKVSEAMRAQIETLQVERSEQEAVGTELQQQLKGARAELARREQELERVQVTVQERQRELAKVREELSASRSEVEALATELSHTKTIAGELERRELATTATNELREAFTRIAILAGVDALRLCVGSRLDLPLSAGWHRSPLGAPLAATTKGDVASALTEHLEQLGLGRVEARLDDGTLALDCTLDPDIVAAAETAERTRGLASWITEYIRAWLHASRHTDFTLAALRCSDGNDRFSATLHAEPAPAAPTSRRPSSGPSTIQTQPPKGTTP